MEFRYPDDPIRCDPFLMDGSWNPFVKSLMEDSDWVAQPKRNGWRRLAYKENGTWTFRAKRDDGREARKPLPMDLFEKFSFLPIPNGTALDLEWMGMRDVALTQGRNWLEVFDLHYWNHQWQGDVPLGERLRSLSDLIAMCEAVSGNDSLIIVPTWTEGIGEKFLEMVREFKEGKGEGAVSEGVVLKRLDGTLRGNRNRVEDNPGWVKVKYREG